MKNLLFYIIAFAVLIACLTLPLHFGLRRQERMECERWQELKEVYSGWYALDHQIEQCSQFNIEL